MSPPDLLLDLLRARGPSGSEGEAAKVWCDAADRFADVSTDSLGSSFARVDGDGRPSLGLFGHIDEIGLTVSHVADDGYLSFLGIGGIDPTPMVGQRVVIRASSGDWVPGVIGRDPQIAWGEPRPAGDKPDESASAPPGQAQLHELRIDIGATDRDDALKLVRVGDPGLIDAEPLMLANGRIAARALDNRIGAYLALETARRASERGESGAVTAVATVQEELGCYGATAAVHSLSPEIAIAIDVEYAGDGHGAKPQLVGNARLGSGAVITRSPNIHPGVVGLLEAAAERCGAAYTLVTSNETTETDADVLQISRAGIPTALVSVPVRNMHTCVEVAQLSDIEAAAGILSEFAGTLPEELPPRWG